MSALLEQIKTYAGLVEHELQMYLENMVHEAHLKESMAYSLMAGGKRLRPSLALATCRMFGENEAKALPFACALEMIHTYSLIHDDLPAMDNDDLRRGKPTNHKVFGEAHAILAGDGLLSLAFEIMADVCMHEPSMQNLQAMYAVALGAGVKGMVAGQSLDLLSEQSESRDESLLETIHRKKTGAMLLASLEAGAFCANADQEALTLIRTYGEAYGILFQITDDILDAVGNAKNLGKTPGKDAGSNKLTFVTKFGLEGAKEQARLQAARAEQALLPFGERAWFLKELVQYTLTRNA